MFYDTAGNAHGLRHDPFKAIVSPRPIGWIGTRAADGAENQRQQPSTSSSTSMARGGASSPCA